MSAWEVHHRTPEEGDGWVGYTLTPSPVHDRDLALSYAYGAHLLAAHLGVGAVVLVEVDDAGDPVTDWYPYGVPEWDPDGSEAPGTPWVWVED